MFLVHIHVYVHLSYMTSIVKLFLMMRYYCEYFRVWHPS